MSIDSAGRRLRVQTVRYAAPEPTNVDGSRETLRTLHEAGSLDVERWSSTGESLRIGGLGLTTITFAEHDCSRYLGVTPGRYRRLERR